MKLLAILLPLALTQGSVGCSAARQSRAGTDLQALIIAEKEFAKRYPGRMSHFNIGISDDPKYGQWNVWFIQEGNDSDPGGDSLIRVNKRTGKLTLEPSF
jgi:hypothetical protein